MAQTYAPNFQTPLARMEARIAHLENITLPLQPLGPGRERIAMTEALRQEIIDLFTKLPNTDKNQAL
jgi:hypothetical protein